LFRQNEIENIDIKEVHFTQSSKDLTDAKIHHLLSETMAKSLKKNKSEKLEGDKYLLKKSHSGKKAQKRKKLEEKYEKVRVKGTLKQLKDEKIHEVIATEDSNPPSYEDILSFVVKKRDETYDHQTINFAKDTTGADLPWKIEKKDQDNGRQQNGSKDYIFFNRKESKNSLYGENEDRKLSFHTYDIEFLNSLTNRKSSRANTVPSLQDPENFDLPVNSRERSILYFENE